MDEKRTALPGHAGSHSRNAPRPDVRNDQEDASGSPRQIAFRSPKCWRHLSHSEGHCYRARLDRFMSRGYARVERVRPQEHLELYQPSRPEDAFDHFEEQRENNLEYLRTSTGGGGGTPRYASAGGSRSRSRNAPRMGAARSRTRPPDGRAGARAQVPGGRGPHGQILPIKAMKTFTRIAAVHSGLGAARSRRPTVHSDVGPAVRHVLQEQEFRPRDRQFRIRHRYRQSLKAGLRGGHRRPDQSRQQCRPGGRVQAHCAKLAPGIKPLQRGG